MIKQTSHKKTRPLLVRILRKSADTNTMSLEARKSIPKPSIAKLIDQPA